MFQIVLFIIKGNGREWRASQKESGVRQEEEEKEEALVPADGSLLRHLRSDLQVRDALRAARQGPRGEVDPRRRGRLSAL